MGEVVAARASCSVIMLRWGGGECHFHISLTL